MVVPPEAAKAAKEQPKQNWQQFMHYASSFGGNWFEEWEYDKTPAILNGLVPSHGPNYALAKTMQFWRCMVAASVGQLVSAPVAPPTRTENLVRHPTVRAVLEGIQHIPPLMTFNAETTSSLMTAILLSQLQSPQPTLNHPTHVIWDGSVHGGIWRCPYIPASIHAVSYLAGVVTEKGYIPKAEPREGVEDNDDHGNPSNLDNAETIEANIEKVRAKKGRDKGAELSFAEFTRAVSE